MIHLVVLGDEWRDYSVCEYEDKNVHYVTEHNEAIDGEMMDVNCPVCRKDWRYIEAQIAGKNPPAIVLVSSPTQWRP